jgi:hypothetical protein
VRVTGEALDHYSRRESFDYIADQLYILFLIQTPVSALRQQTLHFSASDHIEQMQLHSVDAHTSQTLCGFQHVLPTFTGKSCDDMRTDGDSAAAGSLNRILEAFEVMAPANSFESRVMGRLESVFDPYHGLFGVTLDEVEHWIADTVWPRTDGQPHDIPHGQCLIVNGS